MIGLGPGSPELLTRQAWAALQSSSEIYIKTRHHPVVGLLPAGVQVQSFDALYETHSTLEYVNSRIVDEVLRLGARLQGVVYAVPGNPFGGEATCPEIARRARQSSLPLRVLPGMSFLEPVTAALGENPLPHISLADASTLAGAHVPPFPPSAPALIVMLQSAAVAADVKQALRQVYPADHLLHLVHAPGAPDETVEELPLQDMDLSPSIGPLSCCWVPALDPAASFEAFQEVIAHLRAPDGCPWDREQTHQTLRSSLLEETYEVLQAMDTADPQAMREEFGDLLLQIVLNAQIAIESDEFNMADVIEGIHTKIVRRHPHVFGDLEMKNVDGVLQNWEKLKEKERREKGNGDASLLDGVPLAIPALNQAGQYQNRAARVGFDWKEISGVRAKVAEELAEVDAANGEDDLRSELGDLLFAVVNLARWHQVDAESALREANDRFRQRFKHIESEARKQGRSLSDLSLKEMDALWDEAKRSLRS